MPPFRFDPIARRSVVALALLAPVGCGSEERAAAPPAALEAPAEEVAQGIPEERERGRAEETAALLSWLHEQTVSEASFHDARTLYTWTHADQIAELRAAPVLLTRTHGPSGQESAFDQALAGDRSPLARHLTRVARARRFAWTRPWATRMGWPVGDYGDRLIRVELRADAWIARFDPSAEGDARWEVRTLSAQPVSADQVRRDPRRVAAVYHASQRPGEDGAPRSFREYVIVSEPMIERFTVGGDAELLTRDRDQLNVLADRLRALEARPPEFAEWTRSLPARFRASHPQDTLTALYESGLALGSELYLPEPARVEAIARALEIPVEEPLDHAPATERTGRAQRPATRRLYNPTAAIGCDPTMGCHPRWVP